LWSFHVFETFVGPKDAKLVHALADAIPEVERIASLHLLFPAQSIEQVHRKFYEYNPDL